MAALGMDEKSLVKRRAMLEELRKRIAAPVKTGKRVVLKNPQKLLLAVGEVLVYPVCQGRPINPYAVGKEFEFVKAWKQDAWGAFVVAERGRVFEYLAWYRPLVITEPMLAEPTVGDLRQPCTWLLRNPGTLTARHYSNLALKPVGSISIDGDKLSSAFPKRMSPTSCVVSDISISNNLSVRALGLHESRRIRHGYLPTPRISALSEIESVE
jgi:hypothetical protein